MYTAQRMLASALLALASVAGTLTVDAVRPAAAAPGVYRIMPLGDSITRGNGQTKHEYIGYRGRLQRYLDTGAGGFRYEFVGSQVDLGGRHEGHGGWTVDQIAEHVLGWLQEHRPDVVLLHIGTNNVRHYDSAAGIAEKVAALVATIRAQRPGAHIFVAKIVGTRDPLLHKLTEQYNALVPGVVKAAGQRVYLVDQTTVRGQDLFDYAHPNDFGYYKMAYTWYDAMDRHLARGAWASVVNPFAYRRAHICQRDPVRKRNTCGVQSLGR